VVDKPNTIKNKIHMKIGVLKGLLFLLILSTIAGCQTKKDAKVSAVIDTEQIKKEIQAKEDEFASIFNSGEIWEIGYYADDAVSFTQNRPALVGKAAIAEYYKANMDSISKSNKISFTTNEVFVQNDGSLVVEIGYYRVVDPADKLINSGNYISLFEKRDGRYVCIRDMSISDFPLE
jgi:ketosteroid isomerase-like protein